MGLLLPPTHKCFRVPLPFWLIWLGISDALGTAAKEVKFVPKCGDC